MPDKSIIKKARADARAGKSASTQAGEFVKAEIEKIRSGEHGARSAKQAIAIGLSEARRAGVKLGSGGAGKKSPRVRAQARRDEARGAHPKAPNPKRAKASLKALKREPRSTVSKKALSRQAKSAAAARSSTSRSAAAKKAAATRKRRTRS